MKKEWVWLIALSLCIIFIIPWSVVRWQTEQELENDVQIRVLMPNGGVETLSLEDYLIGVVAAEMPAEFEVEALKAQAIAARTYAAKKLSQNKLIDANYDVDTTVLTQVWLSDTQMKNHWGWLNYWRYRSKLEKVVVATRALVLVSKGEYIDALYHSSSGRKPTERSEEVWNSSRDYLQNVSSGEEDPQRYVKTVTWTPQELYKKLGIKDLPRAFTSGDFQTIGRTSAGRVKSVRVLGRVYQTTQLRTLMGLSSTDLEWVVQPDRLTITTYGNGHAVGMSQWGANDLAKNNSNAEEILAHYYPGTKLMKLGYMQ
ncbi:stage II sporulation protein D [Desulfosporosinus sp. BICA1-9]|uniref:stage II sporulation protein D n=1 Tax=Desulfosporosinus sp. BICA1-9 TaxID=1531958 RepID=UPI00054B62B2|nr:stage II sporulation protein D [Desulfosporosinus sp. BICA1-9]KJS50786.1 MAG: stage II sporulation protein D [Peptococcaceae bacterium BRH_c23]KJS89537.1 MAG: stage II sporulation protein D [Desulfosporosinus sp. BICA1-9]HBW37012.1 stage II sporulation protein D [Desulfosporosinus sp.]